MTTTTTINLVADSKCYGKTGQYIARLTGRDSKFTFQREFIGQKSGSRSVATVDEIGLYEECDLDKRGNKEQTPVLVLQQPDGALRKLYASREAAMQIAKRLDAGEEFADIVTIEHDDAAPADDRYQGWRYRILTKSEAKKAVAAQTIETTIEHCWQALQTLPEREAKAVLKALKERVSSKPQATPQQEQAATADIPQTA